MAAAEEQGAATDEISPNAQQITGSLSEQADSFDREVKNVPRLAKTA